MNAPFMIKLLLLGIVCTWCAAARAQSVPDSPAVRMKTNFFVMLVKGSDRNQDSATVAAMQRGHIENLNRMAAERKLDIAGPIAEDLDWRGILILDMDSESAVRAELERDPMVQAGRLAYRIHPWMSMPGATLR